MLNTNCWVQTALPLFGNSAGLVTAIKQGGEWWLLIRSSVGPDNIPVNVQDLCQREMLWKLTKPESQTAFIWKEYIYLSRGGCDSVMKILRLNKASAIQYSSILKYKLEVLLFMLHSTPFQREILHDIYLTAFVTSRFIKMNILAHKTIKTCKSIWNNWTENSLFWRSYFDL